MESQLQPDPEQKLRIAGLAFNIESLSLLGLRKQKRGLAQVVIVWVKASPSPWHLYTQRVWHIWLEVLS